MSRQRDTGTGGVLESMTLLPLQRGGYVVKTQVVIGKRIGGRDHRIDIVAEKDGRSLLISLKWQQVDGTVEQKVPFETICLADALRALPQYSAAYLVLGGEGWTLREFYTGGGLGKYLKDAERVKVVTLESFIAKANRGEL
jgi:hypothetical protein